MGEIALNENILITFLGGSTHIVKFLLPFGSLGQNYAGAEVAP